MSIALHAASPRIAALPFVERTPERNLKIQAKPISQVGRLEGGATAKVQSVVSRAFLALAAAWAVNYAIITFVAAPLSMVLVNSLIVGFALQVGFEAALGWIQRRKKGGVGEAESAIVQAQNREHTGDMAALTAANIAEVGGPGILIHEMGHAAAASACFQTASPAVEVYPFLGGATSFDPSGALTILGKILGRRGSLLLVTVAGIASSTLCAMAGFALSDRIKESHPNLAKFITCFGISQIANEVFYGLSTFVSDPEELGHDFMRLWVEYGIHPLIPVGMMILLPIIQQIFFNPLSPKHINSGEDALSLSVA